MTKFLILTAIMALMYAYFHTSTTHSKHWIIDKIIDNRIMELKSIIGYDDITFKARIEELGYLRKDLKIYID